NAEADKARRDAVEARNHGEAAMHQTEKALKEFGDKVEPAEKSQIEEAVAALKTVLEKEGAEAEEIRTATQSVVEASMKLGEAMYKAKAGETPADEPGASSNDDGVVDADFEEVDGDKKE
ncbi:MAG: Hsp70 family protein, partial [Amphiplicatus sp.]